MNDFSPSTVSIDDIASKMGDVDKDFIATQVSHWVKKGIITAVECDGKMHYAVNEDQRDNKIEYTLNDDFVIKRMFS